MSIMSNFSNIFIDSFWLGKALQTEDISNITVLKEATLNKWQSCLSPRVRQLLLLEVENNSLNKFLLGNNSSIVKGLLKENVFSELRNDNVPYDTLEAEHFTTASNKIKIIAYQTSQFFDSNIVSTNEFFKLYNDELEWCRNSDIFKKCVELYLEEDYLTALLMVISNLERILGDVIYSLHNDTSVIPSLIRDLLIAPSLVSLLGQETIFFLRCIIGPPSSMNLRNVLWHGFISPHEFLKIPAKWYCALALVITMNICNIIRHKGVIGLLKKRNGVSFGEFYYLTQCIDKADDISIEKIFDELYEYVMYGNVILPQYPHNLILEGLLFTNFFVIPQTHSTWLRSFHHLSSNQAILFFILALPFFEHCLRRIYVCVNKDVQGHRMCTAEVGEYFLTLDIILEEKVPWAFCDIEVEKHEKERMNEIYSEFGGGTMDLLLDLFVHADGPRLRDRIAHGEANHLIITSELFNLTNPLCNYFICLLIVLWNKYKLIKQDHQLLQTIDIESYEKWITNYRSRFHPIPMFWKESVRMITNVWKCWNVYLDMTKAGKFTMGNWIEPSWIIINDNHEHYSLFENGFLKDIVELDSISMVVRECRTRLNKRKLGDAKNGCNKAIYWSEINYTKEDAKVINFRRGAIKKANASAEKLHSILITLHSSTSLSSRKRKNTQTLFNLFPSIFQQLYFALLTLERTRDQKLMLAILIFVERWNGFCVEGNWKDIDKAFEKLLRQSKTSTFT